LALVALAVAVLAPLAVAGQRGRGAAPAAAAARAGKIERATIRDRDVLVYLPGSYDTDPARRYPVVLVVAERPFESLNLPQAIDRLSTAQGFSEPIVVMTDTDPADLVAYVDEHYRTLTARISRGLAGCTTGGDAALRTAAMHPEMFSSLYLLNAAIPDASVAVLDRAAAGLRRYYAIAINAGAKDAALGSNRRLHDAMTRLAIPHYYEEYDGGRAEMGERIDTRLVPFFSRNLSAPANPTSPAVQ
jgi:enterochelin esterase-like enzyme